MTTESKRARLLQIVAIVVVLLLMIVLLRAEGRSFLCATWSQFAIWIGDTCSSSTSQQLLDPYSFTHVLHGFLFFWLVSLLFRRMAAAWQFWLALFLEA